MSKRKLLCAALALSLSLGGCAGNYREIENMAIITGAALDIGKRETYSLTYELVEFGGVDPDSAGKPQYITVEGDTLAECAQNFGLITGKFGFWGHAVILLISEPLAREGLTEPLDWFLKQSQTRLNLYIAVTSGSARALLEAPPVGTQLSAGQLADMLSPQVGSSEKHHFKLFEVFNTLRTGGTALSLPWFTLQNPEDGSQGKPLDEQALETLPEGSDPLIVYSGLAVFDDDRLAGLLNFDDAFVVHLLKNEQSLGVISHDGVSMRIQTSHCSIKSEVRAGEPSFHAELRLGCDISQAPDIAPLDERRSVERITSQMELYLEEHISSSVRRVLRDTHCDVYGFGNLLRMYHPQDWRELEPRFGEVLEQIPLTVTVSISLTGDPRFTEPIAPAGEEDVT